MELGFIWEYGAEFCGSGSNNEMWVYAGSGAGDAGQEAVGEGCLAGGDEEGAAYCLEDCVWNVSGYSSVGWRRETYKVSLQ